MSPVKKRVNPFYILLVIVGIAFCITATAYGVMAALFSRERDPERERLERIVATYGSELGDVRKVE